MNVKYQMEAVTINTKNTVGSRVCQCYKGFILNSEGKTCSGKWPAKLLHF